MHVGSVIPNAFGGSVRSKDGNVVLSVPEQAIMDVFRVISIEPVEQPPVRPPTDRKILGDVYEVREAGEQFTKAATLQIAFVEEAPSGSGAERLGIYGYDANRGTWQHIPSTRREGENAIFAKIRKLDSYYALMAGDGAAEGSVLEPKPGSKEWHWPATVSTHDGHYFISDTFEDDLGEWSNRDNEVGGEISLDDSATFDGTKALKITNTNRGGNFAVNVVTTPFDAREYSTVQFDYRIRSGVKTNLLVQVAGRWYEVGFTDDPNALAGNRVNIAHVGDIQSIVADDQWHTAQFNLYDMLRTKTRNTTVEQVIMADWNVNGYMLLQFGTNEKGATYYIDNFSVGREGPRGLRMASDTILIDNFNQKKSTNALGQLTTTFVDTTGGTITTEFTRKNAHGNGHSLALRYDVPGAAGYAGYISNVPALDLRGYQTLTLFLKGDDDRQDALVGLRDLSGLERKIPISLYLPDGITTDWQKVTIPLVAFSDDLAWSSVDAVTLSFEHQLHSGSTLYVDDIGFDRNLDSFVVDNFDSSTDRNLLGRRHRTFTSGAAAVNGTHTMASEDGIYRLSYGGNIGELRAYASDLKSYGGWTTALGGIDCAKCGRLSFDIRGAEGEENLTIYLDDGSFRWGVEISKYTSVTTDWQTVTIPLFEFAEYGVDLTHLAALQFVFEGAKMSGTIYVDDISFGQQLFPEIDGFVAPGIAYEPRGFEPGQEHTAERVARIREDLRILRASGFRSLVTYGARGALGGTPAIAREEGFDGVVIMGIWDPLSQAEWKNALSQSEFVNGYCLGNEGLGIRYQASDLSAKMAELRAASGRPVTTSEPIDRYLAGEYQGVLLSESDWLFPVAHAYWANEKNPSAAAEWITARCDYLAGLTGRPLLLKEAGLPTSGAEDCSEQAQLEFFEIIESTGVPFFYFEAFDQPWKAGPRTTVEEHWGLFRADGTPKLAADSLEQRTASEGVRE